MKTTTLIRHQLLIVLCMGLLALAGCDSGSSTGPGGGGNGDGDLAFDYCEVVEIENQMHVRWSANYPTRGDFRYGLTDYVQITSDAALTDSHDVLLIGLAFDTDYIYRLTATDQVGNLVDCEGNFTTPLKATPEPIITNIEIVNITENQAILSWITDELATTILYYGTGEMTDSITGTAFDFEHEVTLTDLLSATDYQFRPEAVDVDGLRGVGTDSAFTTAARLILWFGDVQVGVGDTIEVPIHIEGTEDLAALQYELTFEDTLGEHSGNGAVHIMDLRRGPFSASEVAPLFFQDIRNGANHISNEMAWTIEFDGNERVGTPADGDGVIALMKLRGIKSGNLPSSFDDLESYGLDMFAMQRSCSLRTGTITVLP